MSLLLGLLGMFLLLFKRSASHMLQGVVVESTLAMRDKVGEVFRLSHQTGQTIVVDCSAAVQGDQGHGDGGHGDVPGGAVRGGDRSRRQRDGIAKGDWQSISRSIY